VTANGFVPGGGRYYWAPEFYTFSRRRVMGMIAAGAGSVASLGAGPQNHASALSALPPELTWDLVKDLPYAALYGVSPDGRHLLFNFSRNPMRSFAYDGRWIERVPVGSKDDGLRVIEAGSWRVIGGLQLRQLPLRGSFFSDGDAIYVETQGIFEGGGRVSMQPVLIDLRTRKVAEQVEPLTIHGVHPYYVAVGDRSLLGFVFNDATGSTEAIIKAEPDSYREVVRVPFAGARATGIDRYELDPEVSGDRRALVPVVDNSVAYRRTSDLGLVWQQQVDRDVRAWSSAITNGGELAAVYVADVPPIRAGARTQYSRFSTAPMGPWSRSWPSV
jgi:hypothetical protein